MKKLSYHLLAALFAFLSFSPSFSQVAYQPATTASFENTRSSNENVSSENIIAASAVDTKVMRSFIKHFKNTGSEKWYLVNQEYLASFPAKDRQVLAWFGKNGSLIYTIYYGSEKHLPSLERKMVESTYEDYSIGATQEIHSISGTVWVATLENCNNVVKVKITDNGLEELERIKKSK